MIHLRKRHPRPSIAVALSALVVAGAVAIAVPDAHAATCVAELGDGCGPYLVSKIPMSTGYDTYVSNQAVGANSGTTETVTAIDPGTWSLTADAVPYGYTGVQTFPDAQQLTNDWCGNGWGACQNPTDTPLSGLSALKVNYEESSPRDADSIYEFAADVWSNYSSDVMFWVDTHGRCDEGAFGGTELGTAVLDGQSWTVHRYGGTGAEIIFVLDGADGSGTCAQQTSGTIDVKAGFDWLAGRGLIRNPTISQLNTGWEIASADHTTFSASNYSITATVDGEVSPTVTATSGSPAPPSSSAGPTSPPTRGSASSSSTACDAGPTGGSPAPAGKVLIGQDAVQSMIDSNPRGVAEAYPYVAARTGTSASASIFVDSSSTVTAGQLGIYSDDNGHPGMLLMVSSFIPMSGWNTVSMVGVRVVEGQRYWVAELGTAGILAYRDEAAGTTRSETETVGPTLPAQWSGEEAWDTASASLYLSG